MMQSLDILVQAQEHKVQGSAIHSKTNNFSLASPRIDFEGKLRETEIRLCEMEARLFEVEANEKLHSETTGDISNLGSDVRVWTRMQHLDDQIKELNNLVGRLQENVAQHTERALLPFENRLREVEQHSRSVQARDLPDLADVSGPGQEKKGLDVVLERVAAVEAQQKQFQDKQQELEARQSPAASEVGSPEKGREASSSKPASAASSTGSDATGSSQPLGSLATQVQSKSTKLEVQPKNLEAQQLQPSASTLKTTRPTERIHSELEREEAYSVKESMWDACFVQMYCSSRLDALEVMILYSLNMFLQVALIVLIFLNLSGDEWISEQDVQNLLRWRITVAHNIEFYDQPSNTSLTTRVCSRDRANILAGSQTLLEQQVVDYIIRNTPFNGPMLCHCALAIWIVLILIELRDITNFSFAIFSLKRGKPAKSHWHGIGSNITFRIKHIGCKSRLMSIAFLALPRALIALSLFWAGVLFLARSSSMGDLVLNAMALGFVLDMDEHIYVLVPKRTTWALSVTEPIPYKLSLSHSSLGTVVSMFNMLRIVQIVPLLAVIHILILQPQYDLLEEVDSIICGGEQNLVFDLDEANNIVMYAMAADSPDNKNLPSTTCTHHRSCAILQTIGLRDEPTLQDRLTYPPSPVTLAQQVTMGEVMHSEKLTAKEAIADQKCVDVDYSEPARAALKDAIGVEWCKMINASNLFGPCSEIRVRRFCPQTCACQSVSWWYDRSGCPPSCIKVYEQALIKYVQMQAIEEGACVDSSSPDAKVPFKGGNLTFFSEFVQQDLVKQSEIDVHCTFLTEAASNKLKSITANMCTFKEKKLPIRDLVALAELGASGCDGLAFVDVLFDVGLCDFQLRYEVKLGNIAAFCPAYCNQCSSALSTTQNVGYVLLKDQKQGTLPSWARPFVNCGYEWIFCGEAQDGFISDSEMSFYGIDQVPEKIYTFWGEPERFYNFKLVPEAGSLSTPAAFWSMQIYRDLAEPFLLEARMKPGVQQTCQMADVTFEKEGRLYIVIEGDLLNPFTLNVSANDSLSALKERERIHCDEIVHGSTNTTILGRVMATQDPSGRIFEFWADKGVEYKFESCSAAEHGLMLFDGYLRIPALVENYSSYSDVYTSDCSEHALVSVTVQFDEPGRRHVVVTGRGSTGGERTDDGDSGDDGVYGKDIGDGEDGKVTHSHSQQVTDFVLTMSCTG